LGNPYEITWQDYDDPKGFHIFDFNTRKLEFIPNPFKMFHKIDYDDEWIDEFIKNTDFNVYTNTYVKVIVEYKANKKKLKTFMDMLCSVNPFSVNFVENYQNVIEVKLDINQSDDHDILFKRYIDNMQENGLLTDLDSNKLTIHLMNVLNECLSE
jgi:hypothetical protein